MCGQSVEVGAYVLGALDPVERADFERHLSTCAPCGDELSGLAGLPGLLGRLTPAEAEESAFPPPTRLLDGMLARAGHRRDRRRRLLATAAAVVIIAGAGAGIAATQGGDHATRLTATSGPVTAHATVHAAAAGINVDLQLDGVPAGLRCRLVVVGADGTQIGAGSWYASYDGKAGVEETAAIARDQVTSLRIETLTGTLLVAIPVKTT